MNNVFGYFVAIGSGLALGLIIVIIPAAMVWNKIKGGKIDARTRR